MKTFILAILLPLLIVVTALGGDNGKISSVVIDVRSESEWNTGHLEGAVLIPHERIAHEITKVVSSKKTNIYLYCRSGRRSSLAIDELKKSGYENLTNLGTVEQASNKLNRQIVK